MKSNATPWVGIALVCTGLSAAATSATESSEPLRLSVYATAGDVARHLIAPADRRRVLERLAPLRVSRLFLEGRRGDEYVAPAQLREIRGFFAGHGIACAGGIATVPGADFGTRQNAELGWLNWENAKTRRDVARFFAENAPVFDEIIVDDFYCTADTAPESERGRGTRSWGEYRRDLLVSLIDPLMIEPTRAAGSGTRLILKFPQWYDRFHLFGYDPPRMAAPFDEIWVGTEVRNPETRRMGFVQPTEGYVNFRWLTAVAGDKVRGAWFDHIECGAQHFVDQAFQSVLAGARELTLFRLGDVMDEHPGDALLAARLPELTALADRVRRVSPSGIAFYKPAGSDADPEMYLADYLAMIGLPVLPVAEYPENARVAVLPVQAAADPALRAKMSRHLAGGATVMLTPGLVRALGSDLGTVAGVKVNAEGVPALAHEIRVGLSRLSLAVPLELDAGLRASGGEVLIEALAPPVPLLSRLASGSGQVFVLNIRTFSEPDFREAGEWLLAPKPLGWTRVPQTLADALRAALLSPMGVEFRAPPGVALYLFDGGRCVYNFLNGPVDARLDGKAFRLEAHGWEWR